MAASTACRMCGRSFERHGNRRHVYCKQCMAKADKAISKPPVVLCRECGGKFSPPSRVYRFCSDPCRTAFANRRNRGYQRRSMADPEKRAMKLARARVYSAAKRSADKGSPGQDGRREGAGGVVRRRAAAPASDPIACTICGRSFVQRGAGGRHTSCERCRARADREIARVLRVDCKECGKKFSTTNRLVRYCSDPCRADGRRRRAREYIREYVADTERHAARLARGRAIHAAGRSKGGGSGPRRQARRAGTE